MGQSAGYGAVSSGGSSKLVIWLRLRAMSDCRYRACAQLDFAGETDGRSLLRGPGMNQQ